jgi:hypothetical protein
MKKLGATGALVLSVVAAVLVVGVGWFGLISPQRSQASSLDKKVAVAQEQLTTEQHIIASFDAKKSDALLRAAVLTLPAQQQMSQIIRQLSRAIAASRVRFNELTPQPVVAGTKNTQVIPMSLAVSGDYFALQKLLRLLRQSADLNKKGQITGHGRLYSVDGIQFTENPATTASSGGGGPIVATITLSAYVYGAASSTTP